MATRQILSISKRNRPVWVRAKENAKRREIPLSEYVARALKRANNESERTR